jgi:hypothetical protein
MPGNNVKTCSSCNYLISDIYVVYKDYSFFPKDPDYHLISTSDDYINSEWIELPDTINASSLQDLIYIIDKLRAFQ